MPEARDSKDRISFQRKYSIDLEGEETLEECSIESTAVIWQGNKDTRVKGSGPLKMTTRQFAVNYVTVITLGFAHKEVKYDSSWKKVCFSSVSTYEKYFYLDCEETNVEMNGCVSNMPFLGHVFLLKIFGKCLKPFHHPLRLQAIL